MRRGRRRCKIRIARSTAKMGRAEPFLRFTELAAHDPRRKAGAIWAHPLSKIFALSGQSRPCRPNRYKLAGNAASSPGREGDSQNRAVSAGYCMLAFQHWKRDAAPLGSKASDCSFACRAKAVMAHCPWLCAFEKCAAAAYGPGIRTFLCAQGKRSTRRKPARLQARLAAWWNAGHCPLASSRCCGVRNGLFIPVVAQMPFRRGGRLLWKAACGSLDPCWPRQAAP